jgi:hypothetical protein
MTDDAVRTLAAIRLNSFSYTFKVYQTFAHTFIDASSHTFSYSLAHTARIVHRLTTVNNVCTNARKFTGDIHAVIIMGPS